MLRLGSAALLLHVVLVDADNAFPVAAADMPEEIGESGTEGPTRNQ